MTMKKFVRRSSTIAFMMALPLILLIALLVVYPALFSMYLATLNKSMERFVGLGNFEFLFKRDTFWMVVKQSMHLRHQRRLLQGADRLLPSRTSCTPFRPRASASGAACCSCPGSSRPR